MEVKVIANSVLFAEVRQLLDQGMKVKLTAKGTSMLPFIHGDEDQVILFKTNEIEVGDILLCQIGQEKYVLHRLLKIQDDTLLLMGDGNCYATEQCHLHDVLGKVLFIVRSNGKEIDCSNAVERTKSKLWTSFRFMRRYLLAIYKRMP